MKYYTYLTRAESARIQIASSDIATIWPLVV